MERKIAQINIDLGDEKTRTELVEGLRIIANDIERGCYSGIAGWSDVSWDIELGEESEEEDED